MVAAKKKSKPVKSAKPAAKKPAPVPAKKAPAKPAAAKKPAPAPAKKAAKPVAKAAPAPVKGKGPADKKAAAAPKVPPQKAGKIAPAAPVKAAKLDPKAAKEAAKAAKEAAKAEAKAAKEAAKAEAKAAKAAVPKKPVKVFFHEVAVGAERIIKRGDKTSTLPVPVDPQARRKGGGEESPEELVERIERELEHQHIFKRNMLRPQLCTKCGINEVSDRFTIDKELGYCDDCAEILHLGETKEARKIDFHPSLMKKGEGEEGAAEPGPKAEEEDEDEDEDGDGPPAVVPDIDV